MQLFQSSSRSNPRVHSPLLTACLAALATVVLLCGCSSSYNDGGLSNSTVSRHADMVDAAVQDLEDGVAIVHPLTIAGYPVAVVELGDETYTVVSLSRPEYNAGNPGGSYISTGPNGHMTTHHSPPTPASVELKASERHLAVLGRLPLRRGGLRGIIWPRPDLLLMRVMPALRTVVHEGDRVPVVHLIGLEDETVETQRDLLGFTGPAGARGERYNWKQSPTFPERTRLSPNELEKYSVMVIPVESNYGLGFFGAKVPDNLELRWKPERFQQICEGFANGDDPPPGGLKRDSAAWWARRAAANRHMHHAWRQIDKKPGMTFIAFDHPLVMARERLKRTIKHLEASALADSTLDPEGSQLAIARMAQDALRNNGALAAFWRRWRDGEPSLDGVDVSGPEGIRWIHDSGFVLSRLKVTGRDGSRDDGLRAPSPVPLDARIRYALFVDFMRASADGDSQQGIDASWSVGPEAAFQITNDLALSGRWSAIQSIHPELPGGSNYTLVAADYGIGLDYQIPIRVQWWLGGSRLQASAAYRRLELETGISGRTYTASANAAELGLGLISRSKPRFEGGSLGYSIMAFWRFGGYGDFTHSDGEVLSTNTPGQAFALAEGGFGVRIAFGWGY